MSPFGGPFAWLLIVCLVLTACYAQDFEEPADCVEPAPTAEFQCNNVTGLWEVDSLTVRSGERVTFETPCLIRNDLTFELGSIAVFKSDNSTDVGGTTALAADLILDLGSEADAGLFYKLVSEGMTTMSLIHGTGDFQISSTRLQISYKGGCTTVTGSLNLEETLHPTYPHHLFVSHLKKRGTGNCHWIWSSISAIAAMATLVIVPLIEKYVWKIYD